jgi:hypothetical protein
MGISKQEAVRRIRKAKTDKTILAIIRQTKGLSLPDVRAELFAEALPYLQDDMNIAHAFKEAGGNMYDIPKIMSRLKLEEKSDNRILALARETYYNQHFCEKAIACLGSDTNALLLMRKAGFYASIFSAGTNRVKHM